MGLGHGSLSIYSGSCPIHKKHGFIFVQALLCHLVFHFLFLFTNKTGHGRFQDYLNEYLTFELILKADL